MKQEVTFLIYSTALILCHFGCTKDQVSPPEPCEIVEPFSKTVGEIIRNKCNTSGCHDGSSGVGNYNTYKGLRRAISSGDFRREVVLEKTMPINIELTEDEFKILKCWSENGYPEN